MELNGEKIQVCMEDGPVVRVQDGFFEGIAYEVKNPFCVELAEIGSFEQYCIGHYSSEWLECLDLGIASGQIPVGKRSSFGAEAVSFHMVDAYVERVEFSRLDRCRFYMDAVVPVKIRASICKSGFIQEETIGQWFRVRTLFELFPHGFGTELCNIMIYDRRDSDPGQPLSKYLVPVLSSEDIELEAEAMLCRYYPDAMLYPAVVDGEVLAKRMGLTVLDAPLPLELMGQSIFYDCAVKIDRPETDTLAVQANTILVNSRIQMSGAQRNATIIHECCHHYEHDLFIWAQKQYREDINGINCPIDKNSTSRDSPLYWAERQAKAMTYCIQMNRMQLCSLVSIWKAQYESSIARKNENDKWEWLIHKTAGQFHVSAECAKYRFIEVGYREVRGVLKYINNRYQPPYFFENNTLQKNQTFSIGLLEAAFELGRNKTFRAAVESGRYVYVEGKFCLNHEHYIRREANGKLSMTDFARRQAHLCCLRFEILHEIRGSDYAPGRLNRKKQSDSIAHTVFSQDGETNDPAVLASIIQWATAVNKTTAGMDFGETLCYLMKERGMTTEQLEERSQISARTLRRLRGDPEYDVTREQVVALAVGLALPPIVSIALLRKAGLAMKNTERHNIYSMILYTMYPAGIQAVNALLTAQNVPPLSSLVTAS